MQLVAATPRPAPHPTWKGIAIASVDMWDHGRGYRVPLVSSGARGRVEGYDSNADAMRAAHQLSRGAEQAAVAVIEREARWYVEGLVASLGLMSGGTQRLHFEAALPARVGYATLRENATVRPAMSGVVAVVDGSRQLPLR